MKNELIFMISKIFWVKRYVRISSRHISDILIYDILNISKFGLVIRKIKIKRIVS